MRQIEVNYQLGLPTITKEEYLKLKKSIEDNLIKDNKSIIDKSCTKEEIFNILFNDNLFDKNVYLKHRDFLNIVREFIIQKNSFSSWRMLNKYKPIKETKEFRKEKIEKIIERHFTKIK